MTTSHADSHDQDKLRRWYDGLCDEGAGRFPVRAIFLVSAHDVAAHGIFRQFRTSFEARAGRFEDLMIFGQHGISSTVGGLLAKFGLHSGSLPALVLLGRESSTTAYVLPLPNGDGSHDDGRWMKVLASIEDTTGYGGDVLNLASIPGLTSHQAGHGSLVDAVGGVLESLGQSGLQLIEDNVELGG